MFSSFNKLIKMRLIFLRVILTTLALNGVKSTCDSDIITRINSLWGDNAPRDVLNEITGSLTYLYIPHVWNSNEPGYKCIKTVLESNGKATDYHLYEEDVKVVDYEMSENELHITRSFPRDSLADDYVYPVYLKHGVFAFWQCRHDYESFINIGVRNYLTRKDEEEVQQAIAEAESLIKLLEMEIPPRSKAEC